VKALVLVAVAVGAALTLAPGHAASLGVTSARLTGWHSAASVTCTPSTVTVSAAADATVDQAAASTAFGGDATLKVRAATILPLLTLLDTNARTLVRFTLPTVPDLCQVTGATLRLHASAAAGGRTLQVLRASAGWTEGTVTWATQPGTTGTAVTAASGTGWRTWTVTTHVTSMYAGTNNGFVVRDAAESPLLQSHEQFFDSRTAAADRPELVLTFG
jgi:large repetitive protein